MFDHNEMHRDLIPRLNFLLNFYSAAQSDIQEPKFFDFSMPTGMPVDTYISPLEDQ